MRNPYFYQYDSAKWEWTTLAATKFINGFKRFDQQIDNKEQVYIGVYGPTQVGKTTFILTLLGINLIHLNELADKLRGGREKGKSATITCTIFQRTNNSYFEIIWPSGESFTCMHLDEVETVMYKLRQSIYEQENFSMEPLIIKIPNRYFNRADVDQRLRDLSIVDLPGDDSKDAREMYHVNRILKEYIALCKVCIIMEISSQMTALINLDKEIVKDWFELPEQFRIVLTRSISNSSIMNQIISGDIISSEQFKNIYFHELDRVCEDGELQTKVYPLEFGDSWSDLMHTYPEIFNEASNWLTEIFNELVKDLTSIHSPEQEIKKLKSIERFIVKRQEQELDILKEQLNLINHKVERLQLDTELYKKAIKKERFLLTQIKSFQVKWDKFKPKNISDINLPSWSNMNIAQRKTSYLKARFYGMQDDLLEDANDIMRSLNVLVREGQHLNISNFEKFSLSTKLFEENLHFNYLIDSYLRKEKYTSDRTYALQKLNRSVVEFKEIVKEFCHKRKNAIKKSIKTQENKIKLMQEDEEKMIQDCKNELTRQQQKLKEIDQTNAEWGADKARASKLDLFLMESFVSKSKEYKQMIENPQISKEEKWYIHQYWNLMKNQAKRMIDYDK